MLSRTVSEFGAASVQEIRVALSRCESIRLAESGKSARSTQCLRAQTPIAENVPLFFEALLRASFRSQRAEECRIRPRTPHLLVMLFLGPSQKRPSFQSRAHEVRDRPGLTTRCSMAASALKAVHPPFHASFAMIDLLMNPPNCYSIPNP